MLIVLAYDIADAKRRYRLHKMMKEYGSSRQESLFECRLERAEVAQLQLRVSGIIKPQEDSVRCYRVCPKCEQKQPTGVILLPQGAPLIV